MTHPNPPAEPDSTVKAAATVAPANAAKTSRKAPRRATAAAGAPSSMESSTPAILVIDANGMMVPAPAAPEAEQAAQSQDTSDAGHSPAADPAPLEVAETEVVEAEVVETETAETETAESTESSAIEPEVADPKAVESQSVEPEVVEPQSVQLEPESEPEPESVSEPGPESKPDSESEPESASEPDSDSESEPASDPVVPLVSVVAAEAVALPAAVTPGSLSRRERRLAEQQGADGIASAAVESAVSESTDSGRAVSASSASEDETGPELQLSSMAKPAKKRNRFVAFLRGLFFLVVISALVVALGTVLTGQDLNASGPSPTQLQRQAAWEATTKLQSEAVNLAEASSTPQLQKTLSAAATNLGLQAAALSDGLPTEAATKTATASPTSATEPGSAPAPLTVTGLVQGLSANAETLLGGALTAEQAMGRAFASVGTSQLLQAAELASVAGTTVPASTYTPALVDFPAASGPVCTSTLEPRPGATVDSALRTAAVAEQKAVYAYQVAATRFAEPQFSKATALLDRHQHKLELLNDELRLRCLPLAEPVAGFTLDSTFTSLPKQALSILEAQLSTIYGDLAALSPTKGSDQNPNSEPASASAAMPEPEPTASAAGATPLPVNGSNLREMSVLWLLDSTQAYTAWGGSVEALPGFAPEITPGINPEPVVSSAPAS